MKAYLGDGVYADFDGHNIVLSTETGNLIYLDAQVYAALEEYKNALCKSHEDGRLYQC